ncbi:MAG: hypothetical protein WCR54_04530 [Clostridia bacterium]
MKEKKQLVIRIPLQLWEKLNEEAEKEYRSLNGQIEFFLTKAIENKDCKANGNEEEIIYVEGNNLPYKNSIHNIRSKND